MSYDVIGLKGIVNECTRGSRTIDQIFTNVDCSVNLAVSAPFGRSDHAVITWFPLSKKKRVIIFRS